MADYTIYESEYDYFTLGRKAHNMFILYGWGRYPSYSVLAGQAKKVALEFYDTAEDAEQANPGINWSGQYTEPQVSLNHLPDDSDY